MAKFIAGRPRRRCLDLDRHGVEPGIGEEHSVNVAKRGAAGWRRGDPTAEGLSIWEEAKSRGLLQKAAEL